MKYLCELCNYETDRQFCYKKHLTTVKHMKKVDKETNNSATLKIFKIHSKNL